MATKKAPAKKAPTTKAAKLSLIAATVANAREANARKGRDYLHTIESKLTQIEECFYEVGQALLGLRAPAVWGALGATSFEALVDTLPKLSRASSFRLMRIGWQLKPMVCIGRIVTTDNTTHSLMQRHRYHQRILVASLPAILCGLQLALLSRR